MPTDHDHDEARETMEVDIACVGFGPAAGGFLTTLGRGLVGPDGAPRMMSAVADGLPPQIVCYERADDIGFGVSGVVTRARGIRQSFPDLDLGEIPMATAVHGEKVAYLLDPIGASRRPASLRVADHALKALKFALPVIEGAVELPYTPPFLQKEDGIVLSLGQFNQWVGSQIVGSGLAQIWPGTAVSGALIEGQRVVGVRLLDQGTEADGRPAAAYMPGMDIRARLTVVADGPVGAVGRQLDEHFGMPGGNQQREWALGSKAVVKLRDGVDLAPGTVLHTFGYPEPEIMGFFYVHPDGIASVGIFVPSWFESPVRTSYRYLQHYMMHPYLWRYLEGGTLRSWGAKSLQESGRRGEPHLVGDGYARIGEGSGSTNVLTGSGVDEAWTTGVQLADAVLELLAAGKDFSKANLLATYVRSRRESWIESEGRVAERARDGFQSGVVTGLLGMAVTGFTEGKINLGSEPKPAHEHIGDSATYFRGRLSTEELERIKTDCAAEGRAVHDAVMDGCGWPPIPHDGQLLVSHQDALLLGGKVQAPSGFADHVVFRDPELCQRCKSKVCIEMCSGEAIAPGDNGVPAFDREKCVHCGACLWNCAEPGPAAGQSNIDFRAGTGGLHSTEN